MLGTVCLRVMPPPAHVQPALALAQAQRGPPGTLVPWPVGAMPWVQPCALEGWACGARAVGCRARAVGSRGSPQSLSPALRPRDHAGGGAPCVSSSSSGSGRRSAAAARALRSRQASEPCVNDGDGTEAAARGDVRGVRRETAPEGRGWVTCTGRATSAGVAGAEVREGLSGAPTGPTDLGTTWPARAPQGGGCGRSAASGAGAPSCLASEEAGRSDQSP